MSYPERTCSVEQVLKHLANDDKKTNKTSEIAYIATGATAEIRSQ